MYRYVIESAYINFERSFFFSELVIEGVHVLDGTGDSGGAVFKNYEQRTVQVSSRSLPAA